MDELLPYPWTTSDGLCEALRHPRLLAEAYVAPAVRRLIKKALKAARLGWGSAPQIIDVSDDDRFEVALVECLAEASRRRAFFKNLLGMLRQSRPSATHAGGYLAWNVIESLLHDYRVANRLFLGREVLSPGWYWTPDWNPEWLQQKLQQFTSRYHPESRRYNVQLVAALAMWLPSHALSFYRVLYDWDPQARPLLLDAPMDELISAAPPIGINLPGTGSFAPKEESEEAAPAMEGIRDLPVSADASEHSPVMVQQLLPAELAQRPAAAPVLTDAAGQDESSGRNSIPQAEPGSRRDNLLEIELRALVQDGGWAESLPEHRLRELSTQLDKATRAVSGQLDEIERHRQSVRIRLPELLGRLPFSPHLTVAGLMELDSTVSLGAVRAHLVALRQQVEDIISEEQRVATLASRLECPRDAWPLPSGLPSLAMMLDALRSATKDFSALLADLERREQDVAAFLVNLYDSKRSYGKLSAERLCETLHFTLSDRSPSAVLKPFLPLRQEPEIAAVLVALLVRMDSAAAARQLHSAAQKRNGALSWPWLALLSFAQMQDLVHQCQALASPVSFILFEFALAVDRVDVLEYIAPLLDAPSVSLTAARFYREVISYGRIQASLARLLALRPSTPAGLQPVRQDLQAKVLEFLEHPPGMEGIFHHLRSIGYREYLLPLLPTARTGDAAATLLQFDSTGGISAMVNRCIELSGKRRDVEARHEQQTCNYLEECRQLLIAWVGQQAAALTAGPAVDPSHRLLDEHLPMLQREAGSDPSIARLLNLLSSPGQGRSAVSRPPENFGLGCDTVGDEPTLPNDCVILPELTDSFDVRFRQQPVPLRVYLGDSIRQLRTPRTRRAAIDDLIERQAFRAALSAASDKEQEDLVRQAAQRQEAHIREGYAEETRHAEVLRGADTMLDEILREVSEAFAQMEFGEARSYLELLPNEIKRCRLERDPVRNAALEFLREAGQPPPADASIQEMTARVDQLKQQFEDHRWHIVELERIFQHDKLATELRDACGALARRIDRPVLWPKTKISVQLADDMEICKKFIVQRVQYEEDPHAVEFLQGRLARWIPALLTESLAEPEAKCTQLLAPLTLLAQEIRNLCPLRRVNELVSVQLASRETERHPRSRSLSTLLQRRGAAGEPGQQGGGYQDGIIVEVVTSLRAEMEREAPTNDTSRKALYDALREANWQNVRHYAAALRHSEGGSGLAEGMSVDPLMALFGVASVFSIQESSPEDLGHRLRWACIAALVCRELRHELVQAQLTYDRLLVRLDHILEIPVTGA